MAGLKATYQALLDTVAEVGGWGAVVPHEPLSAPTEHGVIACVFPSEPMQPITESSGLAAADARIVITVRLLRNALAEPQQERETDLLEAYDRVMTALLADLTLDGTARSIDVLGESGGQTQGQWGYATIDRAIFRLIDIDVPIMVNNVWEYGV